MVSNNCDDVNKSLNQRVKNKGNKYFDTLWAHEED